MSELRKALAELKQANKLIAKQRELIEAQATTIVCKSQRPGDPDPEVKRLRSELAAIEKEIEKEM